MERKKLDALLAKMSAIAYLPPKAAEERYQKLGFPRVKYIDWEGAQCYAVWNQNYLIVCFRGTEMGKEWNDLKADLRAWPEKEKNGRVHKGFNGEVQKVLDRVQITIDQMRHKKQLYFTGHSLGGAMATIAAGLIKDVDYLCTFGSPRVGWNKYVKSISCEHVRYVNNNDIVPSVPPSFLFYRHHGELKYINYHGNIRKMSLWQRIKDQWRGRIMALKKKVPFDGIYDHDIKYYIRYTEKLEKEE